MEDKEIIGLYLARDEKAIKETARKYGAYCFTVSHNILGDPQSAEECVNDTWLEVWRSIPPHKPAVFKLFLAKITRNLALDYYRKTQAQKRGAGRLPLILDELAEVIPGHFNPEETLYYRELLQQLEAFLASLSDYDKTIFLQRYFYAVPLEEIAEQAGCSRNALTVRLYRLRQTLKSRLESEAYDD